MNRTDAIKAVIWLDQLAAVAKAEAAKVRAELLADARAEFDEQGTASTWRLPDLATVATAVSQAAVYVSDESAFTDWVAKRYPTEIVGKVRPAWQADFLMRTPGSAGVVEDPDTGEVVPGLGIRRGGDFAGISIRPTPAAKQVFAALAEHGLRELVAKASPEVPVVLAAVDA